MLVDHNVTESFHDAHEEGGSQRMLLEYFYRKLVLTQ